MLETEAGTTIIQFGHCQLFTNRRELFVDGVPAPLGSRAFDVLQMLVDAGGDLVTKDEILSRIWPGIVVEENTLQVQITRVRRALGRDRGFLKTICRPPPRPFSIGKPSSLRCCISWPRTGWSR